MTFSFDARISERQFDMQFALHSGETVALLGPNGAGKSTLLDVIAGLVRADSGRAELDGRVLFDLGAGSTAHGGVGKSATTRKSSNTSGATWVAPHRRGVSMLAQDALLFPHLSVRDNVAFGPRSAGATRSAANAISRRWLEEVDAAELADRSPSQLSGGQAQRIAVARALATEPHLLLLDEPMAALDITLAPAIRRMLKRVLTGRSAIIVTHDILDALILADRVIIVENGRIADQGPTRSVFSQPRSQFSAELSGLNLLHGIKAARGLIGTAALDTAAFDTAAFEIFARDGAVIADGTVVCAAIPPATITVTKDRPPDESFNRVFLRVQDLEPRGDLIRVRTDLLSADVAPQLIADLDVAPHNSYWFSFSDSAPTVYARERPLETR